MKLTSPFKILLHTNYPCSSSSSSSLPSLFVPPTFHIISKLKPHRRQPPPSTTTTTSTSTTNSRSSSCAAVSVRRNRRRDKVLVIMGATGAGKSRLSIDLATRFSPSEIVNTDKIQLYRGLDITTNKITPAERLGVPHHLLGAFDSSLSGDLSPAQFRRHAASAVSGISSRRRLPILVGGSNSFLHALLSRQFESGHDDPEEILLKQDTNKILQSERTKTSTRYRCCFLWVDVSLPVLYEYLKKRVDEMIDAGMVDELEAYYGSGEVDGTEPGTGLRKAIGVPEFETYFRRGKQEEEGEGEKQRGWAENEVGEWDRVRKGTSYNEAVRDIKENTCRLAKRQLEKIQRLKCVVGWDLHRLDATDALRGALEGYVDWRDVWETEVVEPSVKIVKRFLNSNSSRND